LATTQKIVVAVDGDPVTKVSATPAPPSEFTGRDPHLAKDKVMARDEGND
jgi:hypothetical protein